MTTATLTTHPHGDQVLVSDDSGEPISRHLVRGTWEKWGHTVVSTWDGAVIVIAPPEP